MFKSKNKKITPSQNFAAGDLVFMREAPAKHKARELYMVDSMENIQGYDYINIRKAGNQFRVRTYPVRPAELIHAPGHKIRAELAVEAGEKEKLPQRENEKLPLREKKTSDCKTVKTSLSARPKRKAASKARELLRNVFAVVLEKKKKKKPNPFYMYEDYENCDNSSEPIRVNRTYASYEDIGGFGILADDIEQDLSLHLQHLFGDDNDDADQEVPNTENEQNYDQNQTPERRRAISISDPTSVNAVRNEFHIGFVRGGFSMAMGLSPVIPTRPKRNVKQNINYKILHRTGEKKLK